MKNYVQEGDALEFVAPVGGVIAGGFYVIGATFGVARTTAAAGEAFVLDTCGVYALPKKTGETPGPGVAVYWETASSSVTTTVGSNTKIGIHASSVAAVAGASTLPVRLNEAY